MRSWPQPESARLPMPGAARRRDADHMSVTAQGDCRLTSVAGHPEPCPEDRCPFWERGGAVLPGRCGFEQIDLADKAELAGFLLRIRRALEEFRASEEDHEALRLFYRALNEGQDE
jgi:hypothetical protein